MCGHQENCKGTTMTTHAKSCNQTLKFTLTNAHAQTKTAKATAQLWKSKHSGAKSEAIPCSTQQKIRIDEPKPQVDTVSVCVYAAPRDLTQVPTSHSGMTATFFSSSACSKRLQAPSFPKPNKPAKKLLGVQAWWGHLFWDLPYKPFTFASIWFWHPEQRSPPLLVAALLRAASIDTDLKSRRCPRCHPRCQR